MGCMTRYDVSDINDGTGHGLCLEESGCNWGNDSIKMTCSEGVNHCIKLDNKNYGTVRRTCAYFSLTPTQLNQDVLLGSLEGTCFSDVDVHASTGVKKMRGVMQCPCE